MADPVVDGVVGAFVTSQKWRLARSVEHRHAASFIRRRATALLAANPSWRADQGLSRLNNRLTDELGEVRRYLADKLGTRKARGPLYGGSGDTTPNHLDLADVARRKTNEPATTLAAALANPNTAVRRRVLTFLEIRRARVISIVWRAVAVHGTLWAESASHETAILNRGAMTELLDRRLRTLEWMAFTIASHNALGGDSRLDLTGPTGPWTDGFRVRMFEYPRVPNTPAYRTALAGKIAPSSDRSFQLDGVHDWIPSDNGRRLHYNVPPYPGVQFRSAPDAVRPSIRQAPPRTFRLQVVPAAGLTPADVVDRVFLPSTDVWKRCWIFCDHAVAALHVEALLFASRRRTGGPQWFNDIATAHPAGYFSFDSLVGNGRPGEFGGDSTDRALMENAEVLLDDLQPGDHVIFWNSPLYKVISAGDWQLENTLVVDVDSDPDTGGVRLANLIMQGHGTGTKTYPDYQNEIADHLVEAMASITAAIAGRPAGATEVNFKATRVVSWAPYGSFSAPGGWWVEIDAAPYGGVPQALAAITRTVGLETAPLPGYTPPPKSTAVYFPVYQPQVSVKVGEHTITGWEAYRKRLADNPSFRPPRRLGDVRIDGSLMPGLFRPGDTRNRQHNTVPTVRPAVIL